jgi:hypothetical protein
MEEPLLEVEAVVLAELAELVLSAVMVEQPEQLEL